MKEDRKRAIETVYAFHCLLNGIEPSLEGFEKFAEEYENSSIEEIKEKIYKIIEKNRELIVFLVAEKEKKKGMGGNVPVGVTYELPPSELAEMVRILELYPWEYRRSLFEFVCDYYNR